VTEETEERARQLAAEASCARCGEVILESPSAVGAVTGQYRAVAIGIAISFALCGMCGLRLREFISPKVVEDPMYQALRDSLHRAWSR
jgi:transcription elongation factor Elf1